MECKELFNKIDSNTELFNGDNKFFNHMNGKGTNTYYGGTFGEGDLTASLRRIEVSGKESLILTFKNNSDLFEQMMDSENISYELRVSNDNCKLISLNTELLPESRFLTISDAYKDSLSRFKRKCSYGFLNDKEEVFADELKKDIVMYNNIVYDEDYVDESSIKELLSDVDDRFVDLYDGVVNNDFSKLNVGIGK